MKLMWIYEDLMHRRVFFLTVFHENMFYRADNVVYSVLKTSSFSPFSTKSNTF